MRNKIIQFFVSLCVLSPMMWSMGGLGGCSSSDESPGGNIFGSHINLSVTGLSGTATLTLVADDTNTYTITSNTRYQLDDSLGAGEEYSLSITSPSGQVCTLNSGSGTINDDEDNVEIIMTCSTTTYGFSGYVNGLASGDVVTVIANGYLEQSVSGNGAFSFSQEIAAGSALSISASAVGYLCTAYSGSVSSMSADVADVQISCSSVNMFFSAGAYTGNLGGRAGADEKCSNKLTDLEQSGNCSEMAAFLSVTTSDEIQDFPTNYTFNIEKSIYQTSGSKVGDNWADILDGSIDNGISIIGENNFWSGSTSSGALLEPICNGWTDSSSSFNGTYGTDVLTSGSWLQFTNNQCRIEEYLMCLCMQDGIQLSGTVTGLDGTLVVSNGSDSVTLTADSTFYFSSQLSSGDAYDVSITTQPEGQTCVLSNDSGTASNSMTPVSIICGEAGATYSVGGTLSGLSGGTVILTLNSTTATLNVTASGSFTFTTELDLGDSYTVAVSSSPTYYSCSASNATGTISADVSNVSVTCTGTTNFLFPTSSAIAANFGGRTAANTLCATERTNSYSALPCSGVIAFISYSDSDEVRDMPTLYGVDTDKQILDASNSYTKIADTWTDFLDGTIDNALTVDWWSGTFVDSTSAGVESGGFDCNDFTSTNGTLDVVVGRSGQTGDFWAGVSDATCNQTFRLMCLCYQ